MWSLSPTYWARVRAKFWMESDPQNPKSPNSQEIDSQWSIFASTWLCKCKMRAGHLVWGTCASRNQKGWGKWSSIKVSSIFLPLLKKIEIVTWEPKTGGLGQGNGSKISWLHLHLLTWQTLWSRSCSIEHLKTSLVSGYIHFIRTPFSEAVIFNLMSQINKDQTRSRTPKRKPSTMKKAKSEVKKWPH